MFARHIVKKGWIGMIVALGSMVTSAIGGSLDSPAAPTDPASAMYTSQDVYNRLDTGAAVSKRTGAFVEPDAGPTSGTMRTFDDIMAKAPVTNANAATAGAVLSGKVFWGLKQGAWGTRTGTLATLTLSATTPKVEAGYYAETNLVEVDPDLAAANIKTNVTIFGIAGTLSTNVIALVPKTGQTFSYKAGDDGDYRKGVAWPNPRFTIGTGVDGTNCVTDNLTGLMWARNANLGGAMTWSNAVTYCEGLTYGGYNNWRLPNVREILSLLDFSRYGFALCNTAGTGHATDNDPFTGGQTAHLYWSSTLYSGGAYCVWGLSLWYGDVAAKNIDSEGFVWPVRGGQ